MVTIDNLGLPCLTPDSVQRIAGVSVYDRVCEVRRTQEVERRWTRIDQSDLGVHGGEESESWRANLCYRNVECCWHYECDYKTPEVPRFHYVVIQRGQFRVKFHGRLRGSSSNASA